MKRKIVFNNKITGKTIVKEIPVRNIEHLESQKKFKHIVFKDKTKYTRKEKHKKQLY